MSDEQITLHSMESLKRFLNYCAKQGVSPVIVGGWAVWAHVHSEFSVDVDVVLKNTAELDKIKPFFEKDGFAEEINGGISFVKQVSKEGLGEYQLKHLIFDISFRSDGNPLYEDQNIDVPWSLLENNTIKSALDGLLVEIPNPELLLIFKVKALTDRKYQAIKFRTFEQRLGRKRREFKIEKDKRDIQNLVKKSIINQAKLDKILAKTKFKQKFYETFEFANK